MIEPTYEGPDMSLVDLDILCDVAKRMGVPSLALSEDDCGDGESSFADWGIVTSREGESIRSLVCRSIRWARETEIDAHPGVVY